MAVLFGFWPPENNGPETVEVEGYKPTYRPTTWTTTVELRSLPACRDSQQVEVCVDDDEGRRANRTCLQEIIRDTFCLPR